MSTTTCRYTFEQSVLEAVEGSACLKDLSSCCSEPYIIVDSFSSSFNIDPRRFVKIPNKDGYCTLIEDLVSAHLQQNTFCLSKLYII